MPADTHYEIMRMNVASDEVAWPNMQSDAKVTDIPLLPLILTITVFQQTQRFVRRSMIIIIKLLIK